jgi:hypothetical protein
MIKMKFSGFPNWGVKLRRGLGIGLSITVFILVLGLSSAYSFNIDTGNSDLTLRWDNTVKYSTAYRVKDQSASLIANINLDDGDRAFDKGIISNRFDLLSEFDLVFKRDFGARVSGAAWYDTVYLDKNDNDLPYTANAVSVPYNQFTEATKKLHGKDAEILDAFIFANTYIGDARVNFRLGQFAMQWGETFFFGSNGIAGGMAPVDIVKLLSVPSTQFKEVLRPVNQAFGQVEFASGLTIGAYYQFKWEKSRLPATDSYWGNTDNLDVGGERLFTGPTSAFLRGSDQSAKDSGQGGIQVRFPLGRYDMGLYAIRYNDKTPQLYIHPIEGVYQAVYPEGIQAYGASATTTFGITNYAVEVSYRRNTPLTSGGATVLPSFISHMPEGDNNDYPYYAVGQTLHANGSAFMSIGPTFISNEATFIGEVAWNRRLKVTSDIGHVLNPNATHDGLGFRCIYEPAYRQVLPGMDVIVNLGLSYFPKGKSGSYYPFGQDNGGDFSIGFTTTYLDVWRCKLSYTDYYGKATPALDANNNFTMGQSYADRDFISFSIYRTF